MAKGKYEYWLTGDGLLRLAAWARDGLTDEQIAKNIGVSRSTLADWKLRFREISDTLKKHKDIADIEVENALYKRAVGYTAVERRTEVSDDGRKTVVIEKEIPPDVTAGIFWLKNRKPEQWRDRREVRAASEDKIADRINEVFGNA